MALALKATALGFLLEVPFADKYYVVSMNYFASLFIIFFAVGCRFLILMSVICNYTVR